MLDHPAFRSGKAQASALNRRSLFDSTPDPMFDSLTRHLADVWQVPMAAILLLDGDRQWFKSKAGLEPADMAQAAAFCAHMIACPEPELLVCDARDDLRCSQIAPGSDGPAVRFFAGVPLTDRDGTRLGALCVLDHDRRVPTDRQMAALHDLGAVVSGSLLLHHAVSQLAEMAVTDPLTGLYNRKGFEILFERHSDSALGLLALDLDHLKRLNDRHGHAAGDIALVGLARALRASVRTSDVVARLGGDEFAVLVKDADDAAACSAMAERIRWNLARLLLDDERFSSIGVSIGTEFQPAGPKSLVAMMLAADQALYADKRAARLRAIPR